MTAIVPLVVTATLVALTALYVAAEFATVGARRSRVQQDAATGDAKAGRLLEILSDPKRLDAYVATSQVGITLTSLIAGAYGQAQLTPMLEPVFGDAGRAVAVVLVLAGITAAQVIFGELLPKTIAMRYPERLAAAVLTPMRASTWLFRPLVVMFNGSAFRVLGRLNRRGDHSHTHVHSPEELVGLYRASAAGGLIDSAERDMLAGALTVQARMVREVMTPRRQLTTLDATATCAAALAELGDTPHTRFPVFDGPDNVIGLVTLRDLFNQVAADGTAPVSKVAQPILAVPDVVVVPALWQTLRSASAHLALVVNEYGSVTGLVTLEDAIEEIIGEVQDEFDHEVDPIVESDGRVTVRGDVLIETIADRYTLRLDGPVDTVGGWVWHQLGRLPEVGDTVLIGEAGEMRVDVMDGRAVASVSFNTVEVSP